MASRTRKNITGKAIKINRTQLESYEKVEPNALRPNPIGVTTMAVVNGRQKPKNVMEAKRILESKVAKNSRVQTNEGIKMRYKRNYNRPGPRSRNAAHRAAVYAGQMKRTD